MQPFNREETSEWASAFTLLGECLTNNRRDIGTFSEH